VRVEGENAKTIDGKRAARVFEVPVTQWLHGCTCEAEGLPESHSLSAP